MFERSRALDPAWLPTSEFVRLWKLKVRSGGGDLSNESDKKGIHGKKYNQDSHAPYATTTFTV